MATLFVRDVPTDVYEDLRSRAQRAGISINALVLRILQETAEREAAKSDLVRRLQVISSRIQLSPDAPEAADVIREGREEREEQMREWL